MFDLAEYQRCRGSYTSQELLRRAGVDLDAADAPQWANFGHWLDRAIRSTQAPVARCGSAEPDAAADGGRDSGF